MMKVRKRKEAKSTRNIKDLHWSMRKKHIKKGKSQKKKNVRAQRRKVKHHCLM